MRITNYWLAGLSLAIAGALPPASSAAPPPTHAPVAAQVPQATASPALDAFARLDMQNFGTPGMAVVVVDGNTITTHGYGVRRLGAPAKVDAHTIFPIFLIGSNTKAFTTAALAILVALWTPHTLIPIRPVPAPLALTQPQFQAYALGLEVTDYRGHKIITHGGGVLGGISVVVIIPDKHAAFAIMLNSEDAGALFAMRAHLLDSLLGLSAPDWIVRYKQVFDGITARSVAALKVRGAATHPERGPSLPLSGYAGVYRDPWYGTATITQGNSGKGALSISFDRTPGLHGALEHVQYDTFRTHWAMPGVEDAYVTFALKPDGSIDRMTMKVVSPDGRLQLGLPGSALHAGERHEVGLCPTFTLADHFNRKPSGVTLQ